MYRIKYTKVKRKSICLANPHSAVDSSAGAGAAGVPAGADATLLAAWSPPASRLAMPFPFRAGDMVARLSRIDEFMRDFLVSSHGRQHGVEKNRGAGR